MSTHYQGNSAEVLALDTYVKLTRAVETFQSRLAEANTMGNLTSTQFGVLEALYHLGSLSQSEIGNKLLKSCGNITLVIDNLERMDLVRRVRSPKDRRVWMINLTEKGRNLIIDLFPLHADAIKQQFHPLSEEELAELGKLCRKLGLALTW